MSVASCHKSIQTSSADQFRRYRTCMTDTQQLFIGDVLLFLSVSRLLKCHQKQVWPKRQQSTVDANNYNKPDLVELLRKSAVEHLTTCRQLTARDVGFVRRCTRTNVVTIGGVYSCLHRTYSRCRGCGVLFAPRLFHWYRGFSSCLMMTLSH